MPGAPADGKALTQCDVAPQRTADPPSGTATRPRGPHPLPAFLQVVAQVCGGDRDRLARVLAGVRRYQGAPVPPPRPVRREIARIGATRLRDFGHSGPPVVVVPSLINPPTVLDLAPGNSLLDHLAEAGLRPLLVDWGTSGAAESGFDLADHVTGRLLPLIAAIGEPVALAGYCLGGTLAVAAAQRAGDAVTRLALLAAPWRFSGYGDATRAAMAAYWARTEPLAATLGALPMDLLQPAFWSLDPQALAAKFERLAAMPDGPRFESFVTLEDWANDGPPLPLPAARALALDLYRDDSTGSGGWIVDGTRIDPATLAIPILDVVATRDRIVPAAAALSAGGTGTPLLLDAGHVGMVVGSRARDLLLGPLAQWLSG